MAETPALLSFPTSQVASWDHFPAGITPPDSPFFEAQRLTAELRSLDEAFRNGYLRAGFICMEVRSRELWKELDYHSFNDWLIHSAPYSRSHCYAAIKDIEELSEFGQDQLLDIPTGNLPLMKKLSSAVRSEPEVLRWAVECSESEFWAKVQAQYPNQHIEARSVRWMLPESLAKLAGEAIEIVMVRYDCKTRDEALEAIFAEIINTRGVQMQ